MRRALALLLLVVVLAGCAGAPVPPSATTPTPSTSAFRCPAGQAVVGFDGGGKPMCEPFSQAAASSETAQELASNLQVVSVYGSRPTMESGLDTVRVAVELSAGAMPLDLAQLILRFSDGSSTASYEHGRGFSSFWIRGEGAEAVMRPGDLVELRFAPPSLLFPRTSVQLSLIPETGAAVAADFKTPATYGTDLVVTLR